VARLLAPKVRVSATNIFARMLAPGSQGLAYGMNLETTLELAMVLPLPIARDAGEDAVRFIDLSETPKMFVELSRLFEPPLLPRRASRAARVRSHTLVVHDIGSFVASYVPSRADFDRLDPRFRMPDVLFEAVPRYADYGFAVFQLKPGTVTVHPMGLAFPTREPTRLFFPTVHVHDGRFRARAKFDHSLYYQRPGRTEPDEHIALGRPHSETSSWGKPHRSYADLVDRELIMFRQNRIGRYDNDDNWIDVSRP